MKVSGFTFVRNAVKYGYPLEESLRSLLPLVDELVVMAGDSEDGTNKLIESIGSPKIRLLSSVWDPGLRTGGEVLAVETNKAMDAVSKNSDWLFYLQADEVLHEKDYPAIREAMQRYREDRRVEGFFVQLPPLLREFPVCGRRKKMVQQGDPDYQAGCSHSFIS